MKKTDLKLLAFISGVLWLGVLFSAITVQKQKNSYYQVQLNAAQRMEQAMHLVKKLKAERNIPIPQYDYFATGMLGEEFNDITTSIGHLESKRTTANTDFAALAVKMFTQLNLKKGDRIGVGMSGSFPALNIGVLSAAQEMGLDVTVISSLGASTFGANNPQLTFPEMLYYLNKSDIIAAQSQIITIGGDFDTGGNMDKAVLNDILNRLNSVGLDIYIQPDYSQNLQKRIETYGKIDCFISIGGNITSTGTAETALSLKSGIIKPEYYTEKFTQNSGLMAYYLNENIPVINFLNMKSLTEKYHMDFDPASLKPMGSSNIYYQNSYNKLPVLAAVIICAVLLFKNKRRHINDKKI